MSQHTATKVPGRCSESLTSATTQAVNGDSIGEIVAAGRSRWKIENENNTPLKTQGYPFEHNCGHGRTHLSSLLAGLIILAFLTHTILEWTGGTYRLLRRPKLPLDRVKVRDPHCVAKDTNAARSGRWRCAP